MEHWSPLEAVKPGPARDVVPTPVLMWRATGNTYFIYIYSDLNTFYQICILSMYQYTCTK